MMSDQSATDSAQALRDRLIEAAIPHVCFDGWSMAALRAGARDAGLGDASADLAFPGGPVEAVEHYVDLADRMMEAELLARGAETMKIRDRITLAIRVRLERAANHPEAVRRALGLLALPQNALVAARLTWRTVDAIWYAIGDTSADFSYYTRRATLAGVYSTTLIYWLDDESEDKAETWAFLDRRIEDVMNIPKVRKRLEARLAKLPSPFRALRLMSAAVQRR